MAHDVFISYSSKDKTVAIAACSYLEQQKIRCWIAPRDVTPGIPYAESLIKAIDSSKVIVLGFSGHANNSPQVLREIERGVSKGLAILPFRIEDVAPTKSMEFYLSAPHWLDAMTPPLESHLKQLSESILYLAGPSSENSKIDSPDSPQAEETSDKEEPISTSSSKKKTPRTQNSPPPPITSEKKRPGSKKRNLLITCGLLSSVLILGIVASSSGWFSSQDHSTQASENGAPTPPPIFKKESDQEPPSVDQIDAISITESRCQQIGKAIASYFKDHGSMPTLMKNHLPEKDEFGPLNATIVSTLTGEISVKNPKSKPYLGNLADRFPTGIPRDSWDKSIYVLLDQNYDKVLDAKDYLLPDSQQSGTVAVISAGPDEKLQTEDDIIYLVK